MGMATAGNTDMDANANVDAVAEALLGCDPRVRAAYELARNAHAGQADKAGRPYILHPVMVAAGVRAHGATAMAAALLHDVVEDAGVPLDGIRTRFGDAVADAVTLLTHDPALPYPDYVRRVAESGNQTAILVKLSDLTQNMNLARLPKAGEKDVERVRRKYLPAVEVLLAAL
ncbi:MAG: HD domain-containing protein [Parafannyhessea sp.]|uniref:HD domain-containing protein n=1 Tax=Parafannyhessea sp. TaxID=2847324 RepID=UPI003F0B9185